MSFFEALDIPFNDAVLVNFIPHISSLLLIEKLLEKSMSSV